MREDFIKDFHVSPFCKRLINARVIHWCVCVCVHIWLCCDVWRLALASMFFLFSFLMLHHSNVSILPNKTFISNCMKYGESSWKAALNPKPPPMPTPKKVCPNVTKISLKFFFPQHFKKHGICDQIFLSKFCTIFPWNEALLSTLHTSLAYIMFDDGHSNFI